MNKKLIVYSFLCQPLLNVLSSWLLGYVTQTYNMYAVSWNFRVLYLHLQLSKRCPCRELQKYALGLLSQTLNNIANWLSQVYPSLLSEQNHHTSTTSHHHSRTITTPEQHTYITVVYRSSPNFLHDYCTALCAVLVFFLSDHMIFRFQSYHVQQGPYLTTELTYNCLCVSIVHYFVEVLAKCLCTAVNPVSCHR